MGEGIGGFWQWFSQAWRETTIIQGLMALVFVGAFVGRLFVCGEVDVELVGIVGTVVGFYFGAKVTRTAAKNGSGGGG